MRNVRRWRSEYRTRNTKKMGQEAWTYPHGCAMSMIIPTTAESTVSQTQHTTIMHLISTRARHQHDSGNNPQKFPFPSLIQQNARTCAFPASNFHCFPQGTQTTNHSSSLGPLFTVFTSHGFSWSYYRSLRGVSSC